MNFLIGFIKHHLKRDCKNMDQQQQEFLKRLPGVDKILEQAKEDPFLGNMPKSVLVDAARSAIDDLRKKITRDY